MKREVGEDERKQTDLTLIFNSNLFVYKQISCLIHLDQLSPGMSMNSLIKNKFPSQIWLDK